MKIVERKSFTLEEKQKILNRTACRCGHCGKKLTTKTMTIDHIYPLDKGGTHNEYNLIALCQSCNNNKSNFIHEIHWYGFLLEEESTAYDIELSKAIFSKENNDRNILGSAIITSHFISPELLSKFNRTKAKDKLVTLARLSTPIELRPMYPGDIDDNIIKFIYTEVNKLNDEWSLINKIQQQDRITINVNKYKLIEMLRFSTMYGLYNNNNNAIGLIAYINITDLDDVSENFKNELQKRGHNKAYLRMIVALKDKYTPIIATIKDIENRYMAFTNNVILTIKGKTDAKRALFYNNPLCEAKLSNRVAFLEAEDDAIRHLYLIIDDYYTKIMKEVNKIKEDIKKYEEKVSKEK